MPQPTSLDTCQSRWVCDLADGEWVPIYYDASANQPCSDGDACTSNDVCRGGNVCSGTMQPPGAPAPITASPTTSTTGSYTISWSAATCSPTNYQVYEGGNPVYIGPSLSVGLSGRANGTYSYNAFACSNAGCSSSTAAVSVTVLYPPAVPSVPEVHPDSNCSHPASLDTDPDYAVCWNAVPTATGYDLEESTDNTTWSPFSRTDATSMPFTGKAYGNYYYKVRACNSSGCSPYTASNPSNVVQVITWLSSIEDPVIAPSQPVPAKPTGLSVGTLPGTAGVEGGAASYRLPIEIPPGRAGMQPEIALTYSSRNGNGIAGVGWAILGHQQHLPLSSDARAGRPEPAGAARCQRSLLPRWATPRRKRGVGWQPGQRVPDRSRLVREDHAEG